MYTNAFAALLNAQKSELERSKAFEMLAMAPCFSCGERDEDILTMMEDKVVCDNCYDKGRDV